jgi:hypothetical protein
MRPQEETLKGSAEDKVRQQNSGESTHQLEEPVKKKATYLS